ncbi:MAG: phosphatase PAP2 family protein, partial [Sulfurovaceae bacterium]
VKEYKRGLLIVLLSMMLVPATVGTLKTTTKVPCPHDIVHYGGSYPDVKVLDAYPKDFLHKSNVRCWPAGHASGGFALMSLYFLFKTPKNKKRALIVAIVIGWIMGLYKMLLGDHYLSHTIVTMLLSWLLILIVVKIVYRKDKSLEKVA